MKNILKPLTLFALVAGLASCDNVAEFKTSAFVSFSGTKYTVKENGGSIKIPVNIVADGSKTTTVTYEIIDSLSTAVEGVDYTMDNKTGVITVSTDPAKCDSIEVKPVDMTGTLTKNTTITFKLNEVVEDGIYLGNTTTCTLTIIDVDGGINLLVGNWAGTDLSSSKNPASIEWTLETCDGDPDGYYPDANLKICEGMAFTDPVGNAWEAQCDIYAYYDDNKNEFNIYPKQVFDGGNFGDDIGVLYVALDVAATANGTDTPVTFAVNDGVLTLTTNVYAMLWSVDDDNNLSFSGYTCGYILANAELRKND